MKAAILMVAALGLLGATPSYGRWEYHTVQVWRPGYWTTVHLPCGRYQRQWVHGRYELMQQRVWVH